MARTTKAVVAACVGAVVIAAAVWWIAQDGAESNGSVVDGGPLGANDEVSTSTGFDIPVGDDRTFGSIDLSNTSEQPIEIHSLSFAEVVGGVEVIEIKLDPSQASPGLGDWPPDTYDRLSDVPLVLAPGAAAQVVVGVRRVSDESGQLTGLEVGYSSDGQDYLLRLEDVFTTETQDP